MNPLQRWLTGDRRGRRGGDRNRSKTRPVLESLESRVVLYSASGSAWPNSQIITISFMPDGTSLGGGVTSNLFSTFNSKSGLNGRWQGIILQAAQVWAQQTNINFTVVPDDGAPEGSGPDQQGDTQFGDIRIGGYNFNNSTLALTYQPPPSNNFSVAGDMTFNTGQSFNIGSTYDLFTVAMHEFGHSFGLNESSVTNAIMYGTYTSRKTGLAPDDIAGIQSIYSSNGPRKHDAFNTGGLSNGTLASAASITSLINTTTLTGLVPNLDITTAGQQEYFSFAAPAGAGGTMQLDVQSSGLSLLAPNVTVYGSNGKTVLASASGTGQYGTTLTVSVPNVTPGEVFYVMTQGADNTQMGTGAYALGLNFKGIAPPTQPSPIVASPDGYPEHTGGGQADNSGMMEYGPATPVIIGISPDNGVSASDGVTNNPRISIQGSAVSGDLIAVYCDGRQIGTTVAQPNGSWTYDNTANALADGMHVFTVQSSDPSRYLTPVAYAYTVIIDTHSPAPPSIQGIATFVGTNAQGHAAGPGFVAIYGWTEPFAVVKLSLTAMVQHGPANGPTQTLGTTEADLSGFWVDTISGPAPPPGTYSLTATAMDVAGTTSTPTQALVFTVATGPQFSLVTTGSYPDVGLTASLLDNLIIGVVTASASGTGTSTSLTLTKNVSLATS